MSDTLEKLYASVLSARAREGSRTQRLFRDGVQKMAKKVAEEAVEVGMDALQRKRSAVILESADLLYNLTVLWAECKIKPQDVAAEIARREALYGSPEKLPKGAAKDAVRAPPPADDSPDSANAAVSPKGPSQFDVDGLRRLFGRPRS